MSEYQYYGWQAMDGHLNEKELAEVMALSSHMDEVSPTRAVVTYQWGDFKHKPAQILLKYFDVFIYDSNFGYRRLIFRIPKKLLDPRAIEPYLDDEFISLETQGAYHLLELTCSEMYEFEYLDSGDMLNRLSTLREQIIQGDFRALYITWLASIVREEGSPDNDEVEELPPPPGLNKLDSGLRALAEFFAVDLNLIAAAAGSAPSAESQPLASAIPSLTREEMESHLTDIVNGEAGAVAFLKKQLAQKLTGIPAKTIAPLRALGELFRLRDKISKQRQAQAQREAERKRIQKLEKLNENQDQAWAQVESLCQEKRGNAYNEATQILSDLRDLSGYKGQQAQFNKQFTDILKKFGKSQAFKERLRRAGLV